MDWISFWTILAQVGIVFAAVVLVFPILRMMLMGLTSAVVRALPKKEEVDVEEITNAVLDRIVMLGREASDE